MRFHTGTWGFRPSRGNRSFLLTEKAHRGKHDTKGAIWGSSIGILGNGDMEFDLTTVANTPASQVMEVTYPDSPQTVWQLNLTGANAYRAFRIPSLYPGISWQK
jgi:hypothetical protein